MSNYCKLKAALGISSRNLVHHWDKARAPGQIPGYSNHVNATSRAAKYMRAGGYIGLGIGGVSSLLAVQDVCTGDSGAACKKVKFTEGGKFAGSAIIGYAGGEMAYAASGYICAALGFTTGIGGVVCVAAIVGVGSWGGNKLGGIAGEGAGEIVYERTLP